MDNLSEVLLVFEMHHCFNIYSEIEVWEWRNEQAENSKINLPPTQITYFFMIVLRHYQAHYLTKKAQSYPGLCLQFV